MMWEKRKYFLDITRLISENEDYNKNYSILLEITLCKKEKKWKFTID